MQSQRATTTRAAEASSQKNAGASNVQLPITAPLNPILQLQQTLGNQAVQQLLRSRMLQAKLSISQPGDPFEQEADRVAEKVMRMPAPAVQRACAPCSSGGSSCPKCESEEEKLVQRRVEPSTDSMDASVPDNFLQNLGPGQPLDLSTRAFFEPRFGHDFGGVRVHTGPRAAESAREVNALAYTVGHEVVFGAAQYSPNSASGRSLLAHELVHVMQNGSLSVQRRCTTCAEDDRKLRRVPSPEPPLPSMSLGPASTEDCGDSSVPDAGLNCEGTSRDGPGKVESTARGWELRNFDVDKHFLKPGHMDALKAIVPALKAFIAANPDKQITLTGEASTTAGTCYNMRLSRRRARCAARALQALGIPAASLEVIWIGDIESERRLTLKPAPTSVDIENPNDRRVRIELDVPPQPDCPPAAKLRASKVLDFRFGCLSRTSFSVVIADPTPIPIYREFVWEKMIPSRNDCEFFPDLNPTTTQSTGSTKPVRLAWTEDPGSPSDFSNIAIQKSIPDPSDPVDELDVMGNGQEINLDFPGVWYPSSCEDALKAGSPLSTLGTLRPVGPVQCGPMPVPKTVGCTRPGKEDKEDCSKDRRESGASHFKAKFDPLSRTDKVIEWFGERLDGYEVRFLQIGTIKSDAEKKKSGGDIWRPYLFTAKVIHAPEGCEQRDPQENGRGEATTADEEKLPGTIRPAELVRFANSNVATLRIEGLGTFRLVSEECSSGGTEILAGTVEAWGGVRCEPLEMKSPPAEKTCEVDCPEARRTCAHDAFRFRFGRMDPRNAPPLIQDLLLQTGCGAEAARVNIGALSTHPIWRPFYWVQLASCPFNVRNADLAGVAGKTTLGVKPKLKFKWPPIGLDKVFEADGLRLATKDPDDPAAPSEFPVQTELGSLSLTGSARSSSVGLSGATVTFTKMATAGAPVDWTGSCKSSDKGVLIPAGKVECGWAPAPQHDPAPPDTCPTGTMTKLENFKFMAKYFKLWKSLGSNPGMIQTVTYPDGSPLYKSGEVVTDARFIGQVVGPGGGLEPVVVVFDMKVLAVTYLPGRVDILFTVLSRPCAYQNGIDRVPLRLFGYSCAESITQGQTIKMGNDLPALAPPGHP